jgi:hypothetical protein
MADPGALLGGVGIGGAIGKAVAALEDWATPAPCPATNFAPSSISRTPPPFA